MEDQNPNNQNGDGDGDGMVMATVMAMIMATVTAMATAMATAMETVTVVATVTAMGIMMDQKAATVPSTRTVRFSRNSRNGRMLQDRLLQTCRISTTREKMPEISQQKLTS